MKKLLKLLIAVILNGVTLVIFAWFTMSNLGHLFPSFHYGDFFSIMLTLELGAFAAIQISDSLKD